jgi:surface carbohydrate biosynthesis protein
MKKIILVFKLILRVKFIFKTPKKSNLIIFDDSSLLDLDTCLSNYNFFVMEVKLETINKIYFSFKIFKKIIKNYYKGNLLTVYLVSLIELIKPKVVITTIDNSFKFSDVAKILEKKTNFIAIQNASRHDLLEFDYFYKNKTMKSNILKKFYIPNLYCFGDYEKKLYHELNIEVKNIYPIGNLRLANCLHHIKSKKDFDEKYNSDICLVSDFSGGANKYTKNSIRFSEQQVDRNMEEGFAKLVKYTIKFCIENNMKLIFPLKRDKKYVPEMRKIELDFFKRNLEKQEFDYLGKNLLEKDRDNFSSFRAVLNSKVTVATSSTLLKDKLSVGGKILACNLTKADIYNFPIEGICTLNNCSYLDFEKRLLEICSISKETFFSKIERNKDYVMKFDKNISSIDLIRKKLSQLGVIPN